MLSKLEFLGKLSVSSDMPSKEAVEEALWSVDGILALLSQATVTLAKPGAGLSSHPDKAWAQGIENHELGTPQAMIYPARVWCTKLTMRCVCLVVARMIPLGYSSQRKMTGFFHIPNEGTRPP